MQALKARVKDGYLVMREPTDLPEGQEVELTIVADDELEADDLAALDAAIEDSYADEAAGRVRDIFEAFPQLRSDP
jgi:hypothetical protein